MKSIKVLEHVKKFGRYPKNDVFPLKDYIFFNFVKSTGVTRVNKII